MNRILRFALALIHTSILSVVIENEKIIIKVRPHLRYRYRCPFCGQKCEVYDTCLKPRKWRTLDIARSMCFLEYQPIRIKCSKHGVHVESVPWARHVSRFTKDFEDRVAWMTLYCTISAVAKECRIEWHSVGGICLRVYKDLELSRKKGRFEGLRRIGIDETSYKKGHKYLTVVVDHDRGCLIWAAKGYGIDVLNQFMLELSLEQRRAIEVVTADGAKWIKTLVKAHCINAKWVMDPFHVISWTTDALDEVRKKEWRVAKQAAKEATPKKCSRAKRPKKEDQIPDEVKKLKEKEEAIRGTRFALLKNEEDLTEKQKKQLNDIRRAGSHLFRAWELKEDLRAVFKAKNGDEARASLHDWYQRARRSRIDPIVEVSKKVWSRFEDIVAAIECGVSNARVEAINNKIKVTVKMGYGFRNTDNLIALLMLRCSDVKPTLPGRKPSCAKEKKKAA